MKGRMLVRGKGARARYWEISWEGKLVEACEGALTDVPKRSHRVFPGEREAEAFVESEVHARRLKGWTDVIGGQPTTEFTRRLQPWIRERADLLAAIAANPDDASGYLVYADWLSEREDPRGLLIALQCARPIDRENERKLLEQFADLFLPKERWHFMCEFEWRNGFIKKLTADLVGWGEHTALTQLRALYQHPSCRLLAEIELKNIEANALDHVIEAALEASITLPIELIRFVSEGHHRVFTRPFEGVSYSSPRAWAVSLDDLEADGVTYDSLVELTVTCTGRFRVQRFQALMHGGIATALRSLVVEDAPLALLEALADSPLLDQLDSLAFNPSGNTIGVVSILEQFPVLATEKVTIGGSSGRAILAASRAGDTQRETR